jgi:uncharacterized protein with HEPN domain
MSAPRDDSVFVGDIKTAIARIQSYLEGVDESRFHDTTLLQDAVVRQLEVIGEAAKRLSASFREGKPAIPWKDIIGMRAKLAHDYMMVDVQVVWDTVQRDLPDLLAQLDQ